MAGQDGFLSVDISSSQQRVIGFSPSMHDGFLASPRSVLPESPLAKLLKQNAFPKLMVNTSRSGLGFNLFPRSSSCSNLVVPTKRTARRTPSSLSQSSEPIPIPSPSG